MAATVSSLVSLSPLTRELGARPRTMLRRAHAGQIPGVVEVSARGALHRRWMITRSDLLAYLAQADMRKGVAK